MPQSRGFLLSTHYRSPTLPYGSRQLYFCIAQAPTEEKVQALRGFLASFKEKSCCFDFTPPAPGRRTRCGCWPTPRSPPRRSTCWSSAPSPLCSRVAAAPRLAGERIYDLLREQPIPRLRLISGQWVFECKTCTTGNWRPVFKSYIFSS